MGDRVSRGPATLVFRCDDYAGAGGPTEQVEHQLVELFSRCRLPLTFGLIPASLEMRPDKIQFLKPYVDSGAIQIALHGWDHQPQAGLLASQGIKSEFVGLPLAAQLDRITRGKRLLESWYGKPVKAFIPPWNSYDLNTLEACAQAGFEAFSAAINGPFPGRSGRPALLPGRLTLDTLDAWARDWESRSNSDKAALVTFHAYEFIESGYEKAYFSWEEFCRIVERIARSKRIRVVTLSDATGLKDYRKETLGAFYMKRVFDSYTARRRAALNDWFWAAWYAPHWLQNRGVWSILGKSILSTRFIHF